MSSQKSASHPLRREAVPGDLPATIPSPEWLRHGPVPCLDGLRAVSIFLVILSHASETQGFSFARFLQPIFVQGAIGVDVFFCISGFLITLLLQRELSRTGSISLKGFYTRRVLRIFPAYFAYVLVLFGLVQLHWLKLRVWDWFFILTYTVNYSEGRAWEYGHLWSLSIEEQFYLMWPVVLFKAGVKRARWVLAAALMVGPIFRPAARILFPGYKQLAYGSTLARMDSVVAGCLLALFAFDPEIHHRLWLSEKKAHWLIALATLVLVGSLAARAHSPAYGISIANSVNALAIAAIVWGVITNHQNALGRMLSSRPMETVGRLSYGLYLWQQLFLNPQSSSWVCRWPVNLGFGIAAAVGSYLVIESPFLRIKARLSPDRT